MCFPKDHVTNQITILRSDKSFFTRPLSKFELGQRDCMSGQARVMVQRLHVMKARVEAHIGLQLQITSADIT